MDLERLCLHREHLRAGLLPRLRGTVFHVTTVEAFDAIREDGAIRHNRDGEYPSAYSQSKVSFFRHEGCVSVVDLREVTDEDLDHALRKYFFLNPGSDDSPVFLILHPDIHGRLRPWTEWKEAEPTQSMVVPFIEAGYPGEIPLSAVKRALLVKVHR